MSNPIVNDLYYLSVLVNDKKVDRLGILMYKTVMIKTFNWKLYAALWKFHYSINKLLYVFWRNL